MRILAIMGSPHQGNSWEITQRIQEKLEALGDVEFDYVHLLVFGYDPEGFAIDHLCLVEGQAPPLEVAGG